MEKNDLKGFNEGFLWEKLKYLQIADSQWKRGGATENILCLLKFLLQNIQNKMQTRPLSTMFMFLLEKLSQVSVVIGF